MKYTLLDALGQKITQVSHFTRRCCLTANFKLLGNISVSFDSVKATKYDDAEYFKKMLLNLLQTSERDTYTL